MSVLHGAPAVTVSPLHTISTFTRFAENYNGTGGWQQVANLTVDKPGLWYAVYYTQVSPTGGAPQGSLKLQFESVDADTPGGLSGMAVDDTVGGAQPQMFVAAGKGTLAAGQKIYAMFQCSTSHQPFFPTWNQTFVAIFVPTPGQSA